MLVDVATPTLCLDSVQVIRVLVRVEVQRADVVRFEAASTSTLPAPVTVALEDCPPRSFPLTGVKVPAVMAAHWEIGWLNANLEK